MIANPPASGPGARSRDDSSHPSPPAPRGGADLQTLFETSWRAGGGVRSRGGLGPHLSVRYDGDLSIPVRDDRPVVVANFVETVDGVVALDADGRTGGGEVSGFNPADRFVMGLLRSLADVVLIGGGTMRASGGGPWTGPRIQPGEAEAFRDLRSRLGLAPNPTTLVVTASGRIDPHHPGLRDSAVPVVIASSDEGLARLAERGWPDHVDIRRLPAARDLATSVLAVATDLGARVVLSEAGPHVTAELVRSGVVDELFLTVSPQLAGRGRGVERLSLLEGQALWPTDSRWLRLASVRRAADHLFLRYLLQESHHAG